MGLSSNLNRAFHRVLDSLLLVDRPALNLGRRAVPGEAAIAAELQAAIQRFKAKGLALDTGLVDYRRLRTSESYAQYRACSARLLDFDPALLQGRDRRLAFWINLYNALVVDAVICYGPSKARLADNQFFRWRLLRRAAYIIGGYRYSAEDIEHGILRANRRNPRLPFPQFAADDPRLNQRITPFDPRIHFALNCAARSCPPIAVYDPDRLDQQLDLAARNFINSGAVKIIPRKRELHLSPLFRWFSRDFGGKRGVLDFVLHYLDDGPERDFLANYRQRLSFRYQPYDWSLNQL